MRQRERSSGFSIIELMIAMLVLGVVMVGILNIFSNQKRGYITQKRMLDAQGDARLIGDMMFSDVRMAGFMVPQFTSIASIDGGTSGSDTLCTSDPSVIDDTILDLVNDRFDGASFTSDIGANEDTLLITGAQRDIDGDGNADFTIGNGIIVSDGTKSHCARVTALTSTSVRFAPDTPSGFSASAATGRAVPATIYELSGMQLTRNSLQLSLGVEDIQIEFGIDANDDGQLGVGEFPIHDLDGFDPAQIRTVRLNVLTRTSSEDEALAASGAGRQAVANRVAASSPDAFRRRLIKVTAAPRNLL